VRGAQFEDQLVFLAEVDLLHVLPLKRPVLFDLGLAPGRRKVGGHQGDRHPGRAGRPRQIAAHAERLQGPEVFNVLLQVLDDGRLTDGQGRTVNFKNTVIIMTSNIGSQLILEMRGSDERTYQRMREQVLEALRRQFRPEFLNRVDEVVVFRALTEAELGRIVEIQLDGLRKRLAERRITLEVTDAAKTHLVRVGYDPVFGARPLKRAIQREVETPVARLIVAGKLRDGGRVTVDVAGDGLRVEAVS
jgi:ATP-dependent Clp protease ATP-binding subunit ClpB